MATSREEKIARLRALHAKNSIAPPPSAPEIGDRAEDGAIYVGLSPDTNEPFYAAPEDETLQLSFNAAAERVQAVTQETGKAYRLPTERELQMLFNQRAQIGGFQSDGLYWSSSTNLDLGNCATTHDFSMNEQAYAGFRSRLSVRLVRS